MKRRFPKGHPDNWPEFRNNIFDGNGNGKSRIRDIYQDCRIPTNCFYSVFFDTQDPERFGLMRSGWPIQIPGDKIASFVHFEELSLNPGYDITAILEKESLPAVFQEILKEIGLYQGKADIEMLDLAEPVESKIYGPLSYNDLSRAYFIAFAKFLDFHFAPLLIQQLRKANSQDMAYAGFVDLAALRYLKDMDIDYEILTEPTDNALINLTVHLKFNKRDLAALSSMTRERNGIGPALKGIEEILKLQKFTFAVEKSLGLFPLDFLEIEIYDDGPQVTFSRSQRYQVGVW